MTLYRYEYECAVTTYLLSFYPLIITDFLIIPYFIKTSNGRDEAEEHPAGGEDLEGDAGQGRQVW